MKQEFDVSRHKTALQKTSWWEEDFEDPDESDDELEVDDDPLDIFP